MEDSRILSELKNELAKLSNSEKAKVFEKYFRAYEVGCGDKFYGIQVPELRKISKRYLNSISSQAIEQLIKSEYHEERFLALLFLTELSKKDVRKSASIYLKNLEKVNNWDLVDLSAPKILAPYLENEKKEQFLYDLAYSNNLWYKRISIVSTFYFIKKGIFNHTINIATILINDKTDLTQKAVGWMLREVGKRDKEKLLNFLKSHYFKIGRTCLRYAIEKFSEQERKKILRGVFD